MPQALSVVAGDDGAVAGVADVESETSAVSGGLAVGLGDIGDAKAKGVDATDLGFKVDLKAFLFVVVVGATCVEGFLRDAEEDSTSFADELVEGVNQADVGGLEGLGQHVVGLVLALNPDLGLQKEVEDGHGVHGAALAEVIHHTGDVVLVGFVVGVEEEVRELDAAGAADEGLDIGDAGLDDFVLGVAAGVGGLGFSSGLGFDFSGGFGLSRCFGRCLSGGLSRCFGRGGVGGHRSGIDVGFGRGGAGGVASDAGGACSHGNYIRH